MYCSKKSPPPLKDGIEIHLLFGQYRNNVLHKFWIIFRQYKDNILTFLFTIFVQYLYNVKNIKTIHRKYILATTVIEQHIRCLFLGLATLFLSQINKIGKDSDDKNMKILFF